MPYLPQKKEEKKNKTLGSESLKAKELVTFQNLGNIS